MTTITTTTTNPSINPSSHPTTPVFALNPHKDQQICVCPLEYNNESILILPQEKEIDTKKYPQCVCTRTSQMGHSIFSSPGSSLGSSPPTPSTTSNTKVRPGLFYGVNTLQLLLAVYLPPIGFSIFLFFVLLYLHYSKSIFLSRSFHRPHNNLKE
jgi:hypothetical protein